MKLFEIAKVGCYCDGVAHALEKRRGEDVKVLTLTLRVSPFDSRLATTMPDGVKPTLFKLNSGDPKETLRRADFALGLDRQLVTVFAAPDTADASMALHQVKIHGTYARAQKDRNGYDFVFRATLGPVGKEELEFVQSWLLSQRFCSFTEDEPLLDLDDDADDGEEGTDADVKAARPAPMWDEEQAAPAKPKKSRRNHRPLHSHQSKRKGVRA